MGRTVVSAKGKSVNEQRNLTVWVMVQHCIEPVLHWETPSVRTSSALGAAATTATRAATGRRVEKWKYIFSMVD